MRDGKLEWVSVGPGVSELVGELANCAGACESVGLSSWLLVGLVLAPSGEDGVGLAVALGASAA